MIISAHCVLKKFDKSTTIKNLKKYKGIFGKQIPVWKGKKLQRDTFGAISSIKK